MVEPVPVQRAAVPGDGARRGVHGLRGQPRRPQLRGLQEGPLFLTHARDGPQKLVLFKEFTLKL